ncbi:hypothetical protein GCM10011594_12910 [Nakamurella endophytica]|uniref:Uncharacterized protein n=1 Tax=Nakamurella endophytica TaxID=1748367 RepID=A0A917SRY4_9ACTN|nr:hypothetical protein GCM10011594_12910 [Nakamurella endophytica]
MDLQLAGEAIVGVGRSVASVEDSLQLLQAAPRRPHRDGAWVRQPGPLWSRGDETDGSGAAVVASACSRSGDARRRWPDRGGRQRRCCPDIGCGATFAGRAPSAPP